MLRDKGAVLSGNKGPVVSGNKGPAVFDFSCMVGNNRIDLGIMYHALV